MALTAHFNKDHLKGESFAENCKELERWSHAVVAMKMSEIQNWDPKKKE